MAFCGQKFVKSANGHVFLFTWIAFRFDEPGRNGEARTRSQEVWNVSRARQNLRGRLRLVAGPYNAKRASYGAAWERIAVRMGHEPFRDFTEERLILKLRANAIYGKFGQAGQDK